MTVFGDTRPRTNQPGLIPETSLGTFVPFHHCGHVSAAVCNREAR